MEWFMVFDATFHNISVISWLTVSFIGGENRGNPPTMLPLVTDQLYHNIVSSTPRHERGSNSQL